jgi:hypothetical protein
MKLPVSSVSAETEIANLLYRYAECTDNGDFAGAATLFETPACGSPRALTAGSATLVIT